MSDAEPAEIRRPSAEWVHLLPDDLEILDADGWDRKNFEASWMEPITWGEFLHRVMRSTLLGSLARLDGLDPADLGSAPDAIGAIGTVLRFPETVEDENDTP